MQTLLSNKAETKLAEEVIESITKLNNWIEKNGWAGYDPYGKFDKIYSIVGRNKMGLYAARTLDRVGNMTGIAHTKLFHKLLRINKYHDPKTFTYVGKGYLMLHQMTGESKYLHLARDCGDWLIEDAQKRKGAMWGHPFVWYTSVNNYFHKKNNPNLYISSLAGHFLLDLYDETKEAQYYQMVEQTCQEILSIPYYTDAESRICFWYIRDRCELPIHNGNIYAASLLLRTGALSEKGTQQNTLIDTAQKAIKYHMCHQNADGSWYYFGPPICHSVKTIDNSHTGYNLDAMKLCYAITLDSGLKQSIMKGAKFYEKMFDHNGASLPAPNKRYPVVVHDLAQGIYTFSVLGEFSGTFMNLAKRIANYAIRNMQNEDGSFYYSQVNKNSFIKFPYMRHSQAPMFRALCKLITTLKVDYKGGLLSRAV